MNKYSFNNIKQNHNKYANEAQYYDSILARIKSGESEAIISF